MSSLAMVEDIYQLTFFYSQLMLAPEYEDLTARRGFYWGKSQFHSDLVNFVENLPPIHAGCSLKTFYGLQQPELAQSTYVPFSRRVSL